MIRHGRCRVGQTNSLISCSTESIFTDKQKKYVNKNNTNAIIWAYICDLCFTHRYHSQCTNMHNHCNNKIIHIIMITLLHFNIINVYHVVYYYLCIGGTYLTIYVKNNLAIGIKQ